MKMSVFSFTLSLFFVKISSHAAVEVFFYNGSRLWQVRYSKALTCPFSSEFILSNYFHFSTLAL